MKPYQISAAFEEKLACPIAKEKRNISELQISEAGYPICKIDLPNSPGYVTWELGQDKYEEWEAGSEYYKNQLKAYQEEIMYDKCIYDRFPICGDVLDIGGGVGTVRQFMSEPNKLISIDPFADPLLSTPQIKKEAYSCLNQPLNFIQGNAEFLPFIKESFDVVHMRSMLDHVQVPDLALLEAHRVLKSNGFLLLGISVIGGVTGRPMLKEKFKSIIKEALGLIGLKRFKDYHTWHPTFPGLLEILKQNCFSIDDVFWQPKWNGTVVYVKATKKK